MLSTEGIGKITIAISANGTCPSIIPETAIALSGCFLTMAFQIACIIVANNIIKKTLLSIDK